MDQNTNPEQEAQAAVEQVIPQAKKPGRAALQIFAVIVLLALVAGGVYVWQNNRVAQLESQVADLKKEDTTTKETPTDPYAGWKTYTMKYEKLSFAYPSSFQVEGGAVPAQTYEGLDSDKATIKGSNDFSMYVQTGMYATGGSCDSCKIEYSEPITVLGVRRYLNYVNMGEAKGMVSEVVLADTPTATSGILKGKNIKNDDGSPALMSFTFSYVKNTTGGDTNPKQLSYVKNDPNVQNIKLLLQSLSY